MRLSKFCPFQKTNWFDARRRIRTHAKQKIANGTDDSDVSELINPLLILRSGDAFQGCARVLSSESRSDNPHFVIGYVVLASLSLEQYLKCLLLLEHNKPAPETHDVQLLFKQLKTSTRKRLAKLHKQRAKETPDCFAEFEKYLGRKPTLDDLLETGKDSFAGFRYWYENPKGNIGYGLNMFTELVRERIISLRPGWDDEPSSQAQ